MEGRSGGSLRGPQEDLVSVAGSEMTLPPRAVEAKSLGWTTESAVLPKKAHDIDVGASTIVGLKSVLYETQEDVKEGISREKKVINKALDKDVFQRTSKGVEHRDRAQQARDEAAQKQMDERMRAKVAAYERMAKGQRVEGEEECLVDFDRKIWEHGYLNDEGEHDESFRYSPSRDALEEERDDDMVEFVDEFGRARRMTRAEADERKQEIEEERREWSIREEEEAERARQREQWEQEKEEDARLQQEAAQEDVRYEEARAERKRLIEELVQETHAGRAKHLKLKEQRKKATENRLRMIREREQLRQAKLASSSGHEVSAVPRPKNRLKMK